LIIIPNLVVEVFSNCIKLLVDVLEVLVQLALENLLTIFTLAEFLLQLFVPLEDGLLVSRHILLDVFTNLREVVLAVLFDVLVCREYDVLELLYFQED